MTTSRYEHVEAGLPIDREATVAKNVRLLRESRGISQKQLGAGLFTYGFGMQQRTVAKLEAGTKPLRLNEVAAIAAFFSVPIETLWQDDGEAVNTMLLDTMLDERLSAVAANAHRLAREAEQAVSDYYTNERIERLRDKC